MESNGSSRKELLELIDAACEGLLDEDQSARLEQVLREDAAAAELYARHCQINVELLFAIRGQRAFSIPSAIRGKCAACTTSGQCASSADNPRSAAFARGAAFAIGRWSGWQI